MAELLVQTFNEESFIVDVGDGVLHSHLVELFMEYVFGLALKCELEDRYGAYLYLVAVGE